MLRLISFVLIAVMLPACATAQRSDSVRAQNACRLALQIVQTGHPEPHTAWAYERVASCGPEAGPAVASALRRYRQTRDTTVLDLVSSPGRALRDGTIFEAALEISQDRTASAQARVFAFRVLIQVVAPGNVLRYSELSEPSGSVRECVGLGRHLHHETIVGVPLPSDFAARIRAAAASVAGDPQAEPQVRHAAGCTMRRVRSDRVYH